MEEVIPDFFAELPHVEPIKYVAIFEQNTGKITSIGPSVAFSNSDLQIEVSQELAHDVLSGTVNIHDCFVDFYENTVEVKQVTSLYKIDDVLHRIVEQQYAVDDDAEIFLDYTSDQNLLSIELTERFCGTRKSNSDATRKQPMIWNGDTELVFYITGYNDPHKIYKIITITVSDLVDNCYRTTIDVPAKFSVFTRRLFKRYVINL